MAKGNNAQSKDKKKPKASKKDVKAATTSTPAKKK